MRAIGPSIRRAAPGSSNPRRRRAAKAGIVALVFGAALLGSRSRGEAAEPPSVLATMQCDRAAEPGRVRCSVEVRTTGGRSIAWADVALIELPEFTSALKGRLGPADSIGRDATSQKWAFGIVARKTGEGDAHARVRLVVCEGSAGADASAPRCAPTSVDVHASIYVG